MGLPPGRKIFVTGGAGFIGSHIVDRMLAEGHRVTVYDNFSSGKPLWLAHHEGDPAFTLVKADLLDGDAVREAMKGHDFVWHLGANTDIPSGVHKTDIDLKGCVIATWNVLEAMRHNRVRDLLFASTGAIYGEIDQSPFAESAAPLLPISLYAAGKLSCEAFISAYCHLFDHRAWMFRFGNVIGSRMGHGVIYDFVQKLRRNPNELEILGDGNQAKNYFLVEECIDGMLYAYQNVPMNADQPCDLFNLGTDTRTGVKTIARVVMEEMGLTNAGIRYTGGRRGWPGDQPQVFLSVDKVRKLGWEAKHTSDDAVRIAIRRLLSDPVEAPEGSAVS